MAFTRHPPIVHFDVRMFAKPTEYKSTTPVVFGHMSLRSSEYLTSTDSGKLTAEPSQIISPPVSPKLKSYVADTKSFSRFRKQALQQVKRNPYPSRRHFTLEPTSTSVLSTSSLSPSIPCSFIFIPPWYSLHQTTGSVHFYRILRERRRGATPKLSLRFPRMPPFSIFYFTPSMACPAHIIARPSWTCPLQYLH